MKASLNHSDRGQSQGQRQTLDVPLNTTLKAFCCVPWTCKCHNNPRFYTQYSNMMINLGYSKLFQITLKKKLGWKLQIFLGEMKDSCILTICLCRPQHQTDQVSTFIFHNSYFLINVLAYFIIWELELANACSLDVKYLWGVGVNAFPELSVCCYCKTQKSGRCSTLYANVV